MTIKHPNAWPIRKIFALLQNFLTCKPQLMEPTDKATEFTEMERSSSSRTKGVDEPMYGYSNFEIWKPCTFYET